MDAPGPSAAGLAFRQPEAAIKTTYAAGACVPLLVGPATLLTYG